MMARVLQRVLITLAATGGDVDSEPIPLEPIEEGPEGDLIRLDRGAGL